MFLIKCHCEVHEQAYDLATKIQNPGGHTRDSHEHVLSDFAVREEHHRCALVSHAKFVGVNGHRGDPGDREVKVGDLHRSREEVEIPGNGMVP